MALAGRAASALFGARWLRQRLRRRCGLRRLPSFFSEVPVEVREYRQNCGMLWHQDEVLTDPPDEPQLELVYTLENTSDSKTCWATSHLHVLREEIEEVWTAPNSILLLQAKGAVHMVRELTEGHRVIFKSCYRP